MSKQRLDAAIAASIRRDSLRELEQQGAWVIRRSKVSRQRSKNERDAIENKRTRGSATCFHDLPYTLACSRCKRTTKDAVVERERIAHLLKNE